MKNQTRSDSGDNVGGHTQRHSGSGDNVGGRVQHHSGSGDNVASGKQPAAAESEVFTHGRIVRQVHTGTGKNIPGDKFVSKRGK